MFERIVLGADLTESAFQREWFSTRRAWISPVHFPLGVLAIAFLLFGSSLAAADDYWQPQSGDWSNPGNWSGNLVPTATDNAWIANGGTATVT